MKHSKIALKLDLSQNYPEAIKEYEQALCQDSLDLEFLINLAFLYWISASQFSWADKYNIPVKERSKAVDRCSELIGIAKSKFPQNCEVFFWEKYFNHRLLFEPLSENDVLKIISTHKEVNNIPYFFLYLFDQKKYSQQRNNLLKECISLPTAKNLYIKSIIEVPLLGEV